MSNYFSDMGDVGDVLKTIGAGLGAGLVAVTNPKGQAQTYGAAPGTPAYIPQSSGGIKEYLPLILIGGGVAVAAFFILRKK